MGLTNGWHTGQGHGYAEVSQIPTASGQWVPAPPPDIAQTVVAADDGDTFFVACKRSFPLRSEDDSFTWIQVRHEGLLQLVKAAFPTAGSLYTTSPGIDARDIYVQREKIRSSLPSSDTSPSTRIAGESLLAYVERHFSYVAEKLASFPEGTTSWHLLWSFYEAGQEIESAHDVSGEMIALVVDSWAYVQESMGRSFVLSCHFYQWVGTSFHKVPISRKIPEYSDLRPIYGFKTKPLTPENKLLLKQRGEAYLRHVDEVHAAYTGFFFTRAFAGASRLMGDGQVILDVKSFRRCNPVLDPWGDDVNDTTGKNAWMPPSSKGMSRPVERFEPEKSHLLPPTLHGFSLRAKRWGEFLVSHVKPIEWRDEAFTGLVLPPSYRRIVRALVTVHASELKSQLMTDVIEGKGNGLVMALHGAPGTGKTLTAEAVAELLKRPLYVVSAGELGITPASLEQQLKEILQLATAWNAVLLIDEADIFLTKRNVNQLERSALVGVFLRLLEYFSGVLILTTNHIAQFDEAFLSRFAVVLKFNELDIASRTQLWRQFLTKANQDIAAFDIDRLAGFVLNGREIKHAVQTAQAIALVEREQLAMSHFEEVLSVARSGVTPAVQS